MIRRLLTASILSVAMATSGLGVVAHAATAPSTTTAVSGVTQTVQTTTTTQTAAPTLDCGTGIVATVCAVVLGPICKDRCAADGAAQVGTAASASPQLSRAASATGVAAPRLFCAPEFQLVCDVLGLTVCRTNGCPSAPRPAATQMAAPSIACSIDLLCVVIGLLCHSCTLDSAVTVDQPRSVQTCTVDLRPNVYCLLQQL